jgi:YidC/Oxa1 family membrane protein insertase
MQDQGKRLLFAVVLALGVMLAWNQIFPSEKKDPPPAATGSGSGSAAGSGSPAAPLVKSVVGATASTVASEAPRGPEQQLALTFAGFDATFSSYGGVLTSWKLHDPRYQHDRTKGQLIPQQVGAGAFLVNFDGVMSSYVLPANAEWKGEKLSDTELRYTYASEALTLTKTFTIYPDEYLVRLKVDVKVNASDAKQALALSLFGFQDPKDDGGGSSRSVPARVWSSSTLRDGTIVTTPPENVLKGPRHEQKIQWTGFDHPYLMVIVAPREAAEGVAKATYPEESPAGRMRTDLVFPVVSLAQGGTLSREFVAYLGPKDYNHLDGADGVAGFPTGFKKAIDLGWFAFIGRPLLWLLLRFYGFLGNWGASIILLTFLVKALTLFWTTRSMRSMKAMALLTQSPKMKGLQEKFKDDKQRLQMETMALYKEHNISPLAGCLPILLQTPIWLALYRMLSSAGELYLQPFIPGWIDDLTNVDPFHILPVVLVGTMFVQARLTPASGDKMQQKMLQYGMPLMFGVMSFFFPAGLTLYIFTNTILSALHSVYMNKFDKPSLAMAAKLKAATAIVVETKPAAKGDKPGAKAAKGGKVIDVVATETPTQSDDAADDGDDEPDDASAKSPSPGGGGGAKGARNKKKRRR